MYKGLKMQYVIKSVPSNDTKALENLLNEMSNQGWDLYSMHEVENDEGFQYNCIFATEASGEEGIKEDEDVVNIMTFKSQMEKMLSSGFSPYESCKEIQQKIQEQRKKINKIKTQLEAQSESPVSKNRKHLNDDMSKAIKELDSLRQELIKIISPESMYSKISQEKLSIHLSEEIIDLVNPDMGAELISETVKIRQKFADELGYIVPKIMFEDDDTLNAYEFNIKIRGIEVIRSVVYPDYLMFYEKDLNLTKKPKDAITTIDETTGEKVLWIEKKKTKDFWQNGLNACEVIAKILEWIVIKNIDELLDYTDVNHYIDIVSEKNMFLIENIIPDFVSVAELKYILSNLLREKVPIKDIVYVFEKINDFSDEASKEDLYYNIRLSLSRFISESVSNKEGIIQAFDLSEKTSQKLFSEIKTEDSIVRVDGNKLEKISKAILKKAKQYNFGLENITIMVPLEVRHMFFMILSKFITNIKVIAKEEISSDYTLEIIDEV